jgi:hypothetical protein
MGRRVGVGVRCWGRERIVIIRRTLRDRRKAEEGISSRGIRGTDSMRRDEACYVMSRFLLLKEDARELAMSDVTLSLMTFRMFEISPVA